MKSPVNSVTIRLSVPCVIYRLAGPKSGYGGKWDPSQWWGCCSKRDQQKTSCVSVCVLVLQVWQNCVTCICWFICFCWLLWSSFLQEYCCEITLVAPLFATVQTLMTMMKATSCSGTFVSVDPVIKQTEVLFGLSWLRRHQAMFSLFFIRCDDETGGPNNDKERFAR